jgi:hypothetical protein
MSRKKKTRNLNGGGNIQQRHECAAVRRTKLEVELLHVLEDNGLSVPRILSWRVQEESEKHTHGEGGECCILHHDGRMQKDRVEPCNDLCENMALRDTGKHAMVRVEWDGLRALIDKGIAPLIHELWKAGLLTFNSCEENRPGWMWIRFAHVAAAEKFLDIVARYEEGMDTLYNRIRGWWQPDEGKLSGRWEYDALLVDLAVEETERDGDIEELCAGPSDFVFSLSVRFPRSDFPTLLERMRRYNELARVEDGGGK